MSVSINSADSQAIRERLEHEIEDAVDADHRWLHVYRPVAVVDDTTLRTVASDEQRPPDAPVDYRYAHSYDLRELPTGDALND